MQKKNGWHALEKGIQNKNIVQKNVFRCDHLSDKEKSRKELVFVLI